MYQILVLVMKCCSLITTYNYEVHVIWLNPRMTGLFVVETKLTLKSYVGGGLSLDIQMF